MFWVIVMLHGEHLLTFSDGWSDMFLQHLWNNESFVVDSLVCWPGPAAAHIPLGVSQPYEMSLSLFINKPLGCCLSGLSVPLAKHPDSYRKVQIFNPQSCQ